MSSRKAPSAEKSHTDQRTLACGSILTQYFPPEVGASQTRLLALAMALRDRGHDVNVVWGSRTIQTDASSRPIAVAFA